jgi:hypothetical protein
VFGGFDSYIEEFFPMLLSFQDKGWNVVAFEGLGKEQCSRSKEPRLLASGIDR